MIHLQHHEVDVLLPIRDIARAPAPFILWVLLDCCGQPQVE